MSWNAKTLDELLHGCVGGDLALEQAAMWPPDVFAIAGAFLECTGAYRWIVDAGTSWPPAPTWLREVEQEGRAWTSVVGDWCDNNFGSDPYGASPLPNGLPHPLAFMENRRADLIMDLALDRVFVTAAVRALALADEACAGLGFPGSENGMTDRAAGMLEGGTCCSFPVDRVRILPKARTPQSGMGLRSLSMNLSLVTGEVSTVWKSIPNELSLDDITILVIPWPKQVDTKDFRIAPDRVTVDARKFGFFTFAPGDPFPVALALERVQRAKELCGGPELVVFPECALTEEEHDQFRKELLAQYGSKAPAVLAGVRGVNGENSAIFSWVLPNTTSWLEEVQHKHHRWNLDRSQIAAYQLGQQLHAAKRWWESIPLERRSVRFFALSDAVVFCPLVCEDLARQEPVTQVVRAVGPTLLIALLLDGPQSKNRWPSRYATVLADDPGTSVLTVSPLGMVERMHVPPHPPGSRNVALWKDCRTGAKELTLDGDKDALLLTISVQWDEEWTADGRRDQHSAAVLSLAQVHQL